MIFLSYEEARKFVRKLNLKGTKEWQAYCKSDTKPDYIPSAPERTYKDKGWIGFGDWLGTGTIANQDRVYLSFKKAREFVRRLGLKNQKEWKEYCKSGNKSEHITSKPERTYKDKGWIGFGDWLGTGTIANQDRVYLSFKKAREFVRKIELKNKQAWSEYSKSNKRPSNIPGTPTQTYKNEWIGWGDWLGTGTIANQDRVYLSVVEAKPVIKKLCKEHGINNDKEWKRFAKTHGKLLAELHLPSNFLDIYSKERFEKRKKQK